MSKWATLGGIGLGVAGFLTGNPALVSAGGAIATGGMAAGAANKASEQQVAATEKAQAQSDALYNTARDEQKRVYEQSNAAFQPYIGLGHGSLGNLGSMVGLQPMAAPTMTQGQPYVNQSLSALAQPPGSGRPVVDPEGLKPAQAAMANASGYGKNEDRMTSMVPRGLVRVEAPTGELRWMPRGEADRYVAAGARILG